MKYTYNPKYYDGIDLQQLRPKQKAIHTYCLSNGILVGMFQGNRGTRPELDFIIKILRTGIEEKPEPPTHTYWVVDLIIKSQFYPKEVLEILKYYLHFYEGCKPFENISERNNYSPQTVEYIKDKYANIAVSKTLPIDYIAIVIELFSLCEKRAQGAFMFKNLLKILIEYIEGKADYMHVIKASMPKLQY